MRAIATNDTRSVVCLFVHVFVVCRFVTTVSLAKTAEPIDRLVVSGQPRLDPRNYVSDGGPDPTGRDTFCRHVPTHCQLKSIRLHKVAHGVAL